MGIDTPLGPDQLLLQRFELSDSISKPFEAHCQLLSVNPQLDIKTLLQQPVCIRLNDGFAPHYFHAIVRDIQQLEPDTSRLTRYAISAVPSLWFLALHHDCRIFQNQTVEEIVVELLREHKIPHRFLLRSSYEKRTYCVQYRESHLNFIERLLEEEGIHYFFEHNASGHTLVMADQSVSAEKTPNHELIRFHRDQDNLPLENVVFEFERHCETTIDRVSLNDFNFQKPRNSLNGVVANAERFEMYDYPGLHETLSEAEKKARLQIEEYDSQIDVVEGKSTVRGLRVGSLTALTKHFTTALNREYLLTSVHHKATDAFYTTSDQHEAEGFVYSNTFTAIPRMTPFRPERSTPRPIVKGSQTAIVTGPKGEEIHTDEYGRVKVQFHWDRRGNRDQNSSCWIRVSQPWAGGRWGSISIPRIGQEVIVDFLEGNPDRPIITGRVYNADQMPPYDLPEGAHRCGTKSQTLAGAGFNEFSMSDAGGEEQIFLHAQKNLDSVVGNNETRAVQNNRKTNIGVDDTISIGNNLSETIGNSQTTKVTNAYVIECDTFLLNAKTSITLHTGASTIKMNQAGVITITGNIITVLASVLSTITAPITSVTGGVMLTLNGILTNIVSNVTNIAASSVARIKAGTIKLNC